MTKSEQIAITNGIICILDMLKVLINPQVTKDKELINAALEHINNTEKLLMELTLL